MSNNKKEIGFPKFMKSKATDLVVIFSEYKRGTVVIGDFENKIGYVHHSWAMQCFEDCENPFKEVEKNENEVTIPLDEFSSMISSEFEYFMDGSHDTPNKALEKAHHKVENLLPESYEVVKKHTLKVILEKGATHLLSKIKKA